ncbi:hypothetical protein Pyn_24914 [Prunus yedoensis var. nudiflora]|uniref:Uncharacterized protein n=1 Tax=Prunus yedoensis var. nudiflora TaxID=2094558 RepID=A0A314YSE4_PRUYE|nr:hypothetical protein Pyn_24914 [Prunus yedoensis var. nudiflora]
MSSAFASTATAASATVHVSDSPSCLRPRNASPRGGAGLEAAVGSVRGALRTGWRAKLRLSQQPCLFFL